MESIRNYLNNTSTTFDAVDELSRSEFDEISLHLNAIEELTEGAILDSSKSYYVRLRCTSFGKLLKTGFFRKPCEVNILKAMQITTNKLVDVYNCNIGFCQSDEISLGLYPRVDRHGKIIPLHYNGKYNKFVSRMVSLATSKFISALYDCTMFDSTIEVSKKEEILRYINGFDMKFSIRLYEGFIPISIYWKILGCDITTKNNYLFRMLFDDEIHPSAILKMLEEAYKCNKCNKCNECNDYLDYPIKYNKYLVKYITSYLELPLEFRKGYLTTRKLRRKEKETEFEKLQRLYPDVQLSISDYKRMKRSIKNMKRNKNDNAVTEKNEKNDNAVTEKNDKNENDKKDKKDKKVINVKDITTLIEGKETITLNQITSLVRRSNKGKRRSNIRSKGNIHTFVDLRLIEVYDYLMKNFSNDSSNNSPNNSPSLASTSYPNQIEMFDSILEKLFELDNQSYDYISCM